MWYLDLNAIHVKSDQNMETRERTVTLLADERFENVTALLDASPQVICALVGMRPGVLSVVLHTNISSHKIPEKLKKKNIPRNH